ncbi:unnamed protein product [Auanema sp. JU1783]|nr:unnamed protein product [Auanema sp. JU1783]
MTQIDEGFSSDEDKGPLSKKQLQEIERRRLKNKKKKLSKKKREPRTESDGNLKESGVDSQSEDKEEKPETDGDAMDIATKDDLAVEIDYVGESPVMDDTDPNFKYFSSVFNSFTVDAIDEKKETFRFSKIDDSQRPTLDKILAEEFTEKNDETDLQKMSRRKLRLAMQPSVAKLKESTTRPDVVEWADVTSRDPFLLVHLKSIRNTVPVPRHWNSKRKYLAGKRGFERPPFQLPDFIRRTGIQEMRESLWEKEDHQSLKSKMRERARPKLGKINIDYQKLHDAFFKWQTKPLMTSMGELYYEGKEIEGIMKDKKPGHLSDELRIALGMPVGPNSHKFPPPWLIAMQRYGPPPSYPNLKVPGLNAPIPEGCAFGYHAGGWGKPPVDDYGKPLYGDVFGVEPQSQLEAEDESRIERRHWGEIGSDVDSDVESEPDDDEDDEPTKVDGIATPLTETGLVTPSGISTSVTGLETPESIELRKEKRDEGLTGVDTPALPTAPAAAYHIIPERKVDRVGGQMMASTHVYDLTKKQAVNENGIVVALDPEAMDLDQGVLQEKYEEQLRKQTRPDDSEDLTDMVAEHTAKQNRKRKAQEQKKQTTKTQESGKKHKDFKF